MALGQLLRTLLRSGDRYPLPTINMICREDSWVDYSQKVCLESWGRGVGTWSLLLMLE